jgi:poly(A) polymerase
MKESIKDPFGNEPASLLESAKRIITTLRQHQHQGYIAGGAVRDFLLNRTPKDIDVVTDATPDQLKAIFPQGKLVGEKFGVVIVDGIDVATFRTDGTYSDGRHPDSVKFSTSSEVDSKRRDATINAMYLDPFSGEILDYHGGQEDIRNKLLRAVGEPQKRFEADHLRILRMDRFASRFPGFTIHPDTEAAMTATSHHLVNIDVERITQELSESMANDPYKTVVSMKKTGVLKTVMPEVDALTTTEFHAVLEVLKQVGTHTTTEFGFSALLFKLHVPVIESLCRRLKFTNDLRVHILGVVALQPRIATANHHQTLDVLKRLMRDKYFPDALKLFGFRVHVGEMAQDAVSFHFLMNLYAGMKHEDLFPVRLLTGDDLIQMGYRPNKAFKSVLDDLEIKQLTGEITTKDQATAHVRSILHSPLP